MSDAPRASITTVDGLFEFFEARSTAAHISGFTKSRTAGAWSDLYCARCVGERRHYVIVRAYFGPGQHPMTKAGAKQACPIVFAFACSQCDAGTYACLTYREQTGTYKLSVFPEEFGGIRTPNTPPPVAYYLDEAHNAELGGARSAAAAMYRAALEQLLFGQGFQKGMLSQKIQDVVTAAASAEAALAGGAPYNGPSWVRELDHDFLALLKEIGNGSIHPNGGDITKQREIDEDLLRVIGDVMASLLELVYEDPVRKRDLKAKLSAKARLLKK